MSETTRRGFLAGLGGILVLAQVPGAAIEVPAGQDIRVWKPFDDVQAPPGWTYEWARSSLMGEPDPLNIKNRLDNGWTFVPVADQPQLALYAAVTVDDAIEDGGLILMQKPTANVELVRQMQQERADNVMKAIGYRQWSEEDAQAEEDFRKDYAEWTAARTQAGLEQSISTQEENAMVLGGVKTSSDTHRRIVTKADYEEWLTGKKT
jgi:hypothetical protein